MHTQNGPKKKMSVEQWTLPTLSERHIGDVAEVA